MGCGRVINYKKEDFKALLKKEYPKGVDIVFESVGGSFFITCLNSIEKTHGHYPIPFLGWAIKDRLIVFGSVSTYSAESGMSGYKVDTLKLWVSLSLIIFIYMVPNMKKLVQSSQQNELKIQMDTMGLDKGIVSVVDGVEYLHTGQNNGKVLVPLVSMIKGSKI
ncbi:hypothetical protein BDA99DRAFT_541989 [Phascolomyces articulosus]|uniref:Uncharacterized protein n=1 Tax=Phascolomyces articulosus TaxID=60185 RepID=A0AAD5P9C0_9FUNG|nr:hypothetical protein BDA99DRAFT_541989 [Phascolomyces articulosus]